MSLDDLLGAWAAGVALPDDAATRIREEILSQPPARPVAAAPAGLPAAWWVQRSRQLATLMVRSSRPAGLEWAA